MGQFDPESHYFVQRRRRFAFLEDWRARRRELAPAANMRLERSPTRNAGVGVLVGSEANVPTRTIDARIIELDPRSATSTHRHAHDAILFVVDGSGESEIGGETYRWGRYDALHTPAHVWHRHRNSGARPARLLAITDAPLVATLGLSRIEDAGDTRPTADLAGDAATTSAASAYERELAAAASASRERARARRHTRLSDVELRVGPKGSASALLVDRSLGFRTTGLSMAKFEIPAGKAQSKHRHPGEAILYIVEGRGHSVIGDRRHEWRTGDAILVNHWSWHQHFNDSERPATVIRMHMWESIIETMQACMDSPLYEDEPGLEERMREVIQASGARV